MSEIETYDEPSNTGPIVPSGTIRDNPRDYFEAGLLIRNLRNRLAEVEKERDKYKAIAKSLSDTIDGWLLDALELGFDEVIRRVNNHGGNVP